MAYKVSEKYNEVIYSGDAKHKLKLLFNGVEYETANVKTESVKIKDNILSNGEERFSLDNFVSKEAEIIIHDIELSDIVGPVSISIGTLVDTEYEYVPIGIFNIQETPTTDNGKTTIKLRDNSVKFDYPYDASEIIEKNGGSVTMLALLQDICTKFSVELGTTNFANKDTTISVWDNAINARQYIMYIAEKAGCIAKIDRQGKLILADINKGEDITITSSSKSLQPKNNLARPLSQLKIQGKSEQETRSGKNLLPVSTVSTTTANGITLTNNYDGTYTLNGTATDLFAFDILKNITLSAGTYTLSGCPSGGAATKYDLRLGISSSNYDYGNGKTLTISSETTYDAVRIVIRSGVTINATFKPMLEVGTTATDFEQYGASPSPDYPSEIKSISGIENLFKVSNDTTSTANVSYTKLTDNSFRISATRDTTTTWTGYVEVPINIENIKPNTNYTLSKIHTIDGTSFNRIGSIRTRINGTYNTIYTTNKLTFTTPENLQSLSLVFYIAYNDTQSGSSTIVFENIQLEEGTTANPYVPYGRYLRIDNVGKNKFDTKIAIYTNRNTTHTIDDTNKITVTSTGTWSRLVCKVSNLKENTAYTISSNLTNESKINAGLYENDNNFNFSANEYFKSRIYMNSDSDGNLTFGLWSNWTGTSNTNSVIFDEIQIEEGSIVTEYEEYRNDVTYVNLAKENLFDKDNVTLNYRLGSDGLPYADNNYFLSDFIAVDSLSSYIYTRIGEDLNEALCYYDENKNFILRKTDLSTSNTYKFTTTETTKYIRIADGINSLDIGKLYKGSSPKDYYDLCSIGNTKDELDVISGKGVKRIGEIVLDGSENWSNPVSEGFYFTTSNYNIANKSPLLSDKYTNYESTDFKKQDYAIGMLYDNVQHLYLKNVNISTRADLITWLSNNPVTVKYELATPEEFEIEPKQVKLYEDVNDISLIDDIETELEATYSGKKEHIQIPVNLLESYKVGDKLKISRVVYEDAIRKFEYGTENDETLYINSANPYITDSTEVQKIYENIRGYELYSLSTGKIIGNPALDSDDIIEFTYNDETYYTLGQNELTYNGVLIQKFNTQIGTKEKAKENVTLNTEDSKYKRMFTRMDQAEGNIELNTSQITNVQSNLKDNYYTIEQANQLIQNAETGVTNTFSEAGGNNIFRNTGLWFKQSDSNNPYEFWQGLVSRVTEERASNSNALLLQSGSLIQEQTVPNGKYTISFKYKKVIELSNIKVKINDVTTELNGVEETEFIQNIEVNSNHINVEFISDTNNGCEIYDLMVNAGNVKLAYSQNQNETTTDTVNISKGITITSTEKETTFKANADGIRTYDKNENRLTEFTDTGMITKKQIVEDEAEIVGILIQRVIKQTWLTKI